jgi:hypothetical protein
MPRKKPAVSEKNGTDWPKARKKSVRLTPHQLRDLEHLLHKIKHALEALMAVAQSILDAQAKLDAAVAANTVKVDALIATVQGSATPAEQDQIANAIAASAAAVEATNAKS